MGELTTPASSIIQIEMSSESLEDVYFEVIDQSARIVKSGKINSITTQLFIGDLTNGLYLIILKKQNGTTYKQKIILTK
ncbi:MAG: T9SS type A sorting domain-containing protein [Pseudobdellovibrionaceae bacterium]